LDPNEIRKQFNPVYVFLRNKWYFDELYQALFVAPVMFLSRRIAEFDKKIIDGFIDSLARWTRVISLFDDILDRYLIDGLVNWTARRTYSIGLALRTVQTGRLRQYVMFIVVGTVALFVLVSYYFDTAVSRTTAGF
jgi:NADH-quinone oxidoreductase subunit L